MTRKHYVMLAQSINQSITKVSVLDMSEAERRTAYDAMNQIAVDLAQTLRDDNPRFDPDHFLTACGCR